MKVGKLKSSYIQKISDEIDNLSEMEMEKIMKMIHLVKKEFLEEKEASIERFKRARGGWKNVKIEKIYKNLNEDWEKWKPIKSV